MKNRNIIYFVSDAHFGVPNRKESLVREKLFIAWLDSIKDSAEEIYIMGDLFEFWFEYKTVVQKGYIRLLGKLAVMSDAGIPIHFFKGNHDVWAFDYLEKELSIKQYTNPVIKQIKGKTFFLAHGDGLGEGDNGYKFLKRVFRCRLNQWFFRWLHPDIGLRAGRFWSNQSRKGHERKDIKKVNQAGLERLSNFSKIELKKNPQIDYFVLGHVHQPAVIEIDKNSKYVSIGDWINHFSFVKFDGNKLELKYFKNN